MTTTLDKEEALLAKIARGETIESADEMTDEYRQHLVNLMTMQADSELAGGLGYVPWIAKAPNLHEKFMVSIIVKDEMRHATAMYKLLADLGIDTEAHIAQHDYSMRIEDGEANIGAERKADDGRVNIFYYPIETWVDFIMFNFCMDRGAGHQLHDVLQGSYGPWRREIQKIFREEMAHVKHGDDWVKKLAHDPATKDECQAGLDKWYLRTMNIFGRPGSRRNALYRKFGLKVRDNDEVRQAFHDDIAPKVAEWGLTLPTWQPSW